MKLPPADVILHAGDITYKGKKDEVQDFLLWFASLPYRHKIFIAGNHDFYFEKEKAADIAAIIPPGVTYLFDNDIVIEGVKIWGSPVTPWFFNWAFNRKRGAPIRKHWDKIPLDTDIILTHGPAYGVLDLVVNNTHTGCVDLGKKIAIVKPKAHVCGHIHEGHGKVKSGGTTFINASLLNESYVHVNKPIQFEI